MTPNSIFVVTLQVIAAVLIFVITYLAIFLSIVICLVVAECIYEGAGVLRAYTVKCDSPEHGVSSDERRNASGPSLLRHTFQHFQHGISGASLFRSHKP
jgi:hypothetical protein